MAETSASYVDRILKGEKIWLTFRCRRPNKHTICKINLVSRQDARPHGSPTSIRLAPTR